MSIDTIAARHRPVAGRFTDTDVQRCECLNRWPCDAAQAAAEAERLRAYGGEDFDPVEYVNEDGRRFAWSESNVRYEEVPDDGASFTLLRKRLTDKEGEAERLRAAIETVLAVWHATGRLPKGAMHDLRAALEDPRP